MKINNNLFKFLLLICTITRTSELEINLSYFEYLDLNRYEQLICTTRKAYYYLKEIGNNQHKDEHDTILPWYTPNFLQELLSWHIKNWDVFEWGAGHSTLWFARHCTSVTSIESNKKWADFLNKEIAQQKIKNAIVKLRKIGDRYNHSGPIIDLANGGEESEYVLAIEEDNKLYDCIIIDGIHRNTCAFHVLKHLKPGGILIVDNMDQRSLGINSTPIYQLFGSYKHYSFAGPRSTIYPDWKTDYWIIR